MNARDTTSEPGADTPSGQQGSALEIPAAVSGRSEFDELVRQWSVDAMHLAGTGPTERFDRITRVARKVLGTDQAAITFLDRDRQWYKADTGGHAGTDVARAESICTHTIEHSDVYVVADTQEDALYRDNPWLRSAGIRFYAGQPLLGPGGEHVGALCVYGAEPRHLTEAERQTLRDLALWVQDELMIVSESAEGHEVQQGLLPTPLVSLAQYRVAGACLPLRSVGGDFYDWYPVAGGAAFTMGGVMGRGVAAAIVAATVRATMRASSRSNGAAVAVETAADTLDADLTAAGAFVTLFHGHLEEETGVLRYIDAGHGLSLIVHHDGGNEHLESTGVPLGAGFENVWQERSAVLLPGDVFVTVSDGVLDAFGGTLDALARVAALARSGLSADAVVEAIVTAATPGAPDDVTVVAVRRDEAFRIGG